MEMKWHPIEDGSMKGIPRDEYILFTVLNKVTGEVYTATGMVEDYFIKEYGYVFVAGKNCPIDIRSLKAWAEFPEPFKPNDCNMCAHWNEWTDEFGDRWAECDLKKSVPIKPEECPLGR